MMISPPDSPTIFLMRVDSASGVPLAAGSPIASRTVCCMVFTPAVDGAIVATQTFDPFARKLRMFSVLLVPGPPAMTTIRPRWAIVSMVRIRRPVGVSK